MAPEFIRHETLIKTNGKKLLVAFCLMNILMTAATESAFPDLSKLIFVVEGSEGNAFVQIKHSLNADKVQVSCGGCQQHGDDKVTKIPCQWEEFIEMTINITMNGRQYDNIPLNVTCNDFPNTNKIINLNAAHVGTTTAHLSWNGKMADTDHYLLIIMDGRRIRLMTESVTEKYIDNLTEKKQHQICITSVSTMAQTGQYACLRIDTAFRTTGPVEDGKIEAINETALSVTWKKPRYRLDQPQGYSVTIKDLSGNVWRLFDISINGTSTNVDTFKGYEQRKLQWKELQSLVVDGLSPSTEYVVTIHPVNRGRKANVTKLSVQTLERESGSISNLKAGPYTNGNLHISFNTSGRHNDSIGIYRIKLYRTKNGVCQQRNEQIVTEIWVNWNVGYIPIKKLYPCRKYRVEVATFSKLNPIEPVGRPVSVFYSLQSVQTPSVIGHFVTSNMLRLSWENGSSLCDNSVMIVRIQSAIKHSSCDTYIVSNSGCEWDNEAIPLDAECSTVVSKTEKGFLSRSVLLIPQKMTQGTDRSVVSVWMFDGALRLVMNASNLTVPASSDCFTDCSIGGYDGIRSATETGGNCSQWKHSSWWGKSNFCTKAANYLWCPVTYNQRKWDFCDVPDCSNIATVSGCVTDTQVLTTNSSISVSWSQPPYAEASIRYIVLLHNADDECEQYALHACASCDTEDSLSTGIKSFFISCGRRSHRDISGNACEFTDLYQYTSYFVYIIAIVNNSNGADVRRLSVKTKMAVPATPSNIYIKNMSEWSCAFTWDESLESKMYGPAQFYKTRLNGSAKHIDLSVDVSYNAIRYNRLNFCKTYCFSVSATNSEGTSSSIKLWINRKPSMPGVVKLKNIPSGPGSERTVSWFYVSEMCRKFYHIIYWTPDNASNPHRLTSSQDVYVTSAVLRGLLTDMLYYVTVTAEMKFDEETGEKIGRPSRKKWFYTGVEKPQIYDFANSVDSSTSTVSVSWTTASVTSESTFEYRIELKDSRKQCQNSVNLTCKGCHHVYRKEFMVRQDLVHKKTTCTSSVNKEFERGRKEFVVDVSTEMELQNFNVTLYGCTLAGCFLLMDQIGTGPRFQWFYFWPLYFSLACCLAVAVIICRMKSRQNGRSTREALISVLPTQLSVTKCLFKNRQDCADKRDKTEGKTILEMSQTSSRECQNEATNVDPCGSSKTGTTTEIKHCQ